jgi:hypothetical protein
VQPEGNLEPKKNKPSNKPANNAINNTIPIIIIGIAPKKR